MGFEHTGRRLHTAEPRLGIQARRDSRKRQLDVELEPKIFNKLTVNTQKCTYFMLLCRHKLPSAKKEKVYYKGFRVKSKAFLCSLNTK